MSTMPSRRRFSHLSCLSFFALGLVEAAVQVGPSDKFYGSDGPWSAVRIQIGGFVTANNFYDSSVQDLDVFPGDYFWSWLPTDDLCRGNPNCGIGGTFSPATADSGGLGGDVGEDSNNNTIYFNPSISDTLGNGLSMEGPIFAQSMNFPDFSGSMSTGNVITDATLVALDYGNRTVSNNQDSDGFVEMGYLSLGADRPTEFSGNGITATVDTFSPSAFYANQTLSGKTKSNSFGLHLGSAAFNYKASLWYGGYDQGRVIGPVATFGRSAPYLQDIVIGVETGGSPFSFQNQSGLLLDNSTTQGAPAHLPVFPDPMTPYLAFPQQTCDKIASHLPVTYDPATNLYLWNTDNSSFESIVTSAAYLGFIFPPSGSATDTITIKVPFALLNLTLAPALSGRSSSVQYFPCQPYTPPDPLAADDYYPRGGAYGLGRAFLQAAFIGRNWGNSVSWIAQAPGPGGSRTGLGYTPIDIEASDTMITATEGDNLFNSSWAGYWKPLAADVSGVNGDSGSSTTTTSKGLSTGAQAGIGVGCAVIGILIIAAIVFFVMRKRRNARNAAGTGTGTGTGVGEGAGAAQPSNDQSAYQQNAAGGAAMTEHKGYAYQAVPGQQQGWGDQQQQAPQGWQSSPSMSYASPMPGQQPQQQHSEYYKPQQDYHPQQPVMQQAPPTELSGEAVVSELPTMPR